MRRSQIVATPLLVIVLAVAASASGQDPNGSAPPSPAAGSSAPVFRTGIDLVALTVTVTDPQQRYITGLGRRDFEVYEDGMQQEVSFFASERTPLDLALLVDTSASMDDKLAMLQEAAVGFVGTLGPHDRGAVVQFQDNVQTLQPLTSEVAALERAIRQTQARGGTALYNALYVALKTLAREARENTEVRRQAVVVLSDGEDTASLLSFDDVMDLARRSGVSIYTIGLRSPYQIKRAQRGGYSYFSQSEFSMKMLAQETGARSFFPASIRELGGVYGAIAEELATQYAMGYTPRHPRRDGGFRRVIVRVVSRPDARPRTRSGYLTDRQPRPADSPE